MSVRYLNFDNIESSKSHGIPKNPKNSQKIPGNPLEPLRNPGKLVGFPEDSGNLTHNSGSVEPLTGAVGIESWGRGIDFLLFGRVVGIIQSGPSQA